MCHTLSSAAAGLHTRTLSPSSEARAFPVPVSQSREGVRVTSAVSLIALGVAGREVGHNGRGDEAEGVICRSLDGRTEGSEGGQISRTFSAQTTPNRQNGPGYGQVTTRNPSSASIAICYPQIAPIAL